MVRSVLLAMVIPVSMAAAGQEMSIGGKWKITADIAGNVSEQTCTFTQNEQDVKGTCEGGAGELSITGKVDGRTVTWQYDITWEGQPLTLVYTGTFESADKILGSVDVQPVGVTGSFNATPAK